MNRRTSRHVGLGYEYVKPDGRNWGQSHNEGSREEAGDELDMDGDCTVTDSHHACA